MSLLPQQIPPPTEPLVSQNQDGSMIVSKNWWLFFYNIALNSLGINGALPAAALQILEATSIAAAGTDAAQFPRQIANLAELLRLPPPPPEVTSRALANVLVMLAQPILVTPLPQAQPVKSITPGASPYVYTATVSGMMVSTGGVVSSIALVRQGTSVTVPTSGTYYLSRLDQLVVTYSGAPTLSFLPT